MVFEKAAPAPKRSTSAAGFPRKEKSEQRQCCSRLLAGYSHPAPHRLPVVQCLPEVAEVSCVSSRLNVTSPLEKGRVGESHLYRFFGVL